MPNIGPLEIAIVLIIALLVFGPKRLPDLGRSLGRGITEFREGLQNAGADEYPEEEEEEDEPAPGDESDPPALETAESPDSVLPGVEPAVTEVIPPPSKDEAASDRKG